MIHLPSKSRPWLTLAILAAEIIAASWASFAGQAYVLSCLPAVTLGLFSSRFASCDTNTNIVYVVGLAGLFVVTSMYLLCDQMAKVSGARRRTTKHTRGIGRQLLLAKRSVRTSANSLWASWLRYRSLAILLIICIYRSAVGRPYTTVHSVSISLCAISLAVLIVYITNRIFAPSFLWLP
jgi:hypothetical protein